MVDSNDRERISECRDELQRFLCEDELRDSILLVLANKQDLPNAMSVHEITDKLGLNALRDRLWCKCIYPHKLEWNLKHLHSINMQAFRVQVPQVEMVCMKGWTGCRTHSQRRKHYPNPSKRNQSQLQTLYPNQASCPLGYLLLVAIFIAELWSLHEHCICQFSLFIDICVN